MALSEHEQKLLEEMERSLYQNEADVVSTAGIGKSQPNYRAIAVGTVVAVAGLILMIVGVQSDLTVLGIVGFLVAFGGVMVAVSIPGRATQSAGASRSGASSKSSTSLMDQLNERWERRQHGESP